MKLTIIQQVIIGDYDSRIKGNLKKRMKVEKVIVHESFVNSKTGFGKTKKGMFVNCLISQKLMLLLLENDIALIEFVEEVDLTVYTPACLPKSGEHFVGKTALATGMIVYWSLIGPAPTMLRSHWLRHVDC